MNLLGTPNSLFLPILPLCPLFSLRPLCVLDQSAVPSCRCLIPDVSDLELWTPGDSASPLVSLALPCVHTVLVYPSLCVLVFFLLSV